MLLPLIVLLVSAAALTWFVFDQRGRGRFRGKGVPLGRAWEDSGVMSMPAEVAGVVVDDDVDVEDVKAILVRLIIEKKIDADIGPSGLRLMLRAPFSSFTRRTELELVRALFVKGESIDRPSLIAEYEKRNRPHAQMEVNAAVVADLVGGKPFNAVEVIEEPLRSEAEQALSGDAPADNARPLFAELKPDKSSKRPRASDYTILLYLVPLYFAYKDPESGTDSEPLMSGHTAAALVLAALVHLLSMGLAHRVRRKPAIGLGDVTTLLLPLIATSFVVPWIQPSGWLPLFGLLFTASIFSVVTRARFVETSDEAAVRVRLGGAADFLRIAIESGPIDLSLVPYAYAFGLGSRLHRVHGRETVESFALCGGLANLSGLMDAFLKPFKTIPE